MKMALAVPKTVFPGLLSNLWYKCSQIQEILYFPRDFDTNLDELPCHAEIKSGNDTLGAFASKITAILYREDELLYTIG